MEYLLLVTGIITCAVFAVHAKHLLISALWLAGVSILSAIVLYLIGAHLMAVIELSLSVGLITILLVFAITMVGANSPDEPVLRLFNWPLVIVMLLLAAGLTLPFLSSSVTTPESAFVAIFWHLRQADILAQIAMIFAGVLGLLGLLAESHVKAKKKVVANTQIKPNRDEFAITITSLENVHEVEQEKI